MTDISYRIVEDDQTYRFNYRVAAIITIGDLILVNKFSTADYTFLPGGRVKAGETAQDAIIRELHEELNVDAVVTGTPFLIENLFHHGEEIFHEISLYFTVDGNALDLPADGEFRDGFQFFRVHPNDLPAARLQPACLRQELQDIPRVTRHIVHNDLKPLPE